MSSRDRRRENRSANPNPSVDPGLGAAGADPDLRPDGGAANLGLDAPGSEIDLDHILPEDPREGLLRRLDKMPGQACHAIRERLAEMLPFFTAAILTANSQDAALGDELVDLENLIKGD